jgi:hypothetical protein
VSTSRLPYSAAESNQSDPSSAPPAKIAVVSHARTLIRPTSPRRAPECPLLPFAEPSSWGGSAPTTLCYTPGTLARSSPETPAEWAAGMHNRKPSSWD